MSGPDFLRGQYVSIRSFKNVEAIRPSTLLNHQPKSCILTPEMKEFHLDDSFKWRPDFPRWFRRWELPSAIQHAKIWWTNPKIRLPKLLVLKRKLALPVNCAGHGFRVKLISIFGDFAFIFASFPLSHQNPIDRIPLHNQKAFHMSLSCSSAG